MSFLHACPTPFHAVGRVRELLLAAHFCELSEADPWPELRPGREYFIVRGGSLIAWVMGSRLPWEEGGGLLLAGAHTDSPALKLRLETAHYDKGVLVAHVGVYGSPIFATYTDRSLALAGIAVLARGPGPQHVLRRLIYHTKPQAIIPNLAIHLNRDANTSQSYNPQTQLKAIFTCAGPSAGTKGGGSQQAQADLREIIGLGEHESCDLQFCSSQEPVLIGQGTGEDIGEGGELLTGSRLDDMAMVELLASNFLELADSFGGHHHRTGGRTPFMLLCNGEEVGSRTYEGAASNFISGTLKRLLAVSAGAGERQAELWQRTQARSFFLSLDGAHASHPAYSEAFDPHYELCLGAGPAIKLPNGASYSSEPHGIAFVRALALRAACPVQLAMPRADRPTGSTIGPIISSQLGIRGIDMGLPMYAMHSLQETVAIADYFALRDLVRLYYQDM